MSKKGGKKIYVIDTNVFLSDFNAVYAFKNNDIVVPLKVLEEIDKHKKRQDGVGANARQVIRVFDALREKGELTNGVKIAGSKGTLIVKGYGVKNPLPEEMSIQDPDNQILATTKTVIAENPEAKVTLVSQDINMRVKAGALGIVAEDYTTNNEIFMIDIYNELGLKYLPNQEVIRNLQDVYLRIYFPKIRTDEIKNILDYLNNDKKVEESRMINVFETINNDLILENEIMTIVENTKLDASSRKLFKAANVIQSIVHLRLRIKETLKSSEEVREKLDLYRIFNEFTVNSDYPFVLYQTIDGNIVYKFNDEEVNKYMQTPDNAQQLTKWFENTPIGVTFRFPINDKFGERFLSVTINENNRLEYKIVWKEENSAEFDDLRITFPQITKLITKINNSNTKQKLYLPDDSEFKYAFINTVQKFELPEKFNINHNDISEFARFFYPYVALVIDPRKRQSQSEKDESGKYGTYLRFKRVSKYDNQIKIEMRIIHLMSNYEATDKQFALEVSKQFNITEDKALEEIEKVKARYPNIKKSRKVLSKLESLPKYKYVTAIIKI